jgi:hypothetical protein
MIKPRLKTSKAWTDVPEDFKLQVSELFKSHFKEPAKHGKFGVLGRIFKNEVILSFSYLPKNSIRPIQFDISTDYSTNSESKALVVFEKLVDCAASLFQSSFDDETFGVPAIWTEIDFDGTMIYAKSEAINHELEQEANKLLGNDFLAEEAEFLIQDGLVTGDLESDDIEKIAETLNKKTTH